MALGPRLVTVYSIQRPPHPLGCLVAALPALKLVDGFLPAGEEINSLLAGLFVGAGATVSLQSEEARVEFLKWVIRQQRLSKESMETTTTMDLWEALPHRICNEASIDIFIPDSSHLSGNDVLIDAHTYLSRHKQPLPATTAAPVVVPAAVHSRRPIPWDERMQPATAPTAQSITKAISLIQAFLQSSEEPAYLARPRGSANMDRHAPTRRHASSTTQPPPPRQVLRGPARSPRPLARGVVTVPPPLGLPPRRRRAGARTVR